MRLSRRNLLLASAAIITPARAAIKDANGNPINATGPHPVFTGLNVNAGVSNSITITSIPGSASTSSTVTFPFSYTGSAPSGMTAVWNPGALAAAITLFSASGGTGSATAATPSAAGTYTLTATGTGPNTSAAIAPNTTVVSGVVSGFPGQAGNPVGFSGSLTTVVTNSITASASNTRFDGGTNPINITGTNHTFTNCYFGVSTNAATGSAPWLSYSSGGGHTFTRCTFGPSPSVVGGSFPPQPPGGGGYTNWPSQRGSVDSVGIPYAQGNQYGVVGSGTGVPPGGLNFQSCDVWGFSNGAFLWSQTNASNPLTVNNCWMHDPCLAPPGAHTDTIGDVQSMAGDYCIGASITNCTIAGVASEGLALQFSPDTVFHNFTFSGNYISCAASWMIYSGMMDPTVVPTNYVFANNTIDSAFTPEFGICGDGAFGSNVAPRFGISGSGNRWRGNKVLPGIYGNGFDPDTGGLSGVIQLTVTLSNQFLWPDMTGNNTDWTGAF